MRTKTILLVRDTVVLLAHRPADGKYCIYRLRSRQPLIVTARGPNGYLETVVRSTGGHVSGLFSGSAVRLAEVSRTWQQSWC